MNTIINAYFELIKNRLRKNKWEYLLVSLLVLLLILIINTIIWNAIHNVFDKSYLLEVINNLYLYFIIVLVPINLYKKVFVNRDIDLFMLAGVCYNTCIKFYYLEQLIKAFLVSMLISSLLLIGNIDGNLEIIKKIFIGPVTVFGGYSIICVIMLIIISIAKKNARSFLYVLFGVLEICGFFLISSCLSNNISVIKLLGNDSNFLLIIIPSSLVFFIISIVFMNNCHLIRIEKNTQARNKHNRMLFSKDLLMFIRDFDRKKNIIVTFLIFSLSMLMGKGENYKISGVYVLFILFVIVIDIQLSLELFFNDKKKYAIYFLVGIKWKDYLKEKKKMISMITFFSSVIYCILILIRFTIPFQEIIMLCVIVSLGINSISDICCNNIAKIVLQEYSFYDVKTIITCIKRIVIFLLELLYYVMIYYLLIRYINVIYIWVIMLLVEFVRFIYSKVKYGKLTFEKVIRKY